MPPGRDQVGEEGQEEGAPGQSPRPTLWLPPPSRALDPLGPASPLTLEGERSVGAAPGDVRAGVGMMGAASGVCAGVLGSLLLSSPADAEPDGPREPLAPATPVLAGRVDCSWGEA